MQPCTQTGSTHCQILATQFRSLFILQSSQIWPCVSAFCWQSLYLNSSLVLVYDCPSSQADHAGLAYLPVLCRTKQWDCTNLLTSLFSLPSLILITDIELHWPGTEQTLSIQHQPLASALTAQNCLWDQVLVERVISHDFLVIAFNDLILSPSRRQWQLRALSIRAGAQCLTNWDFTWAGFLRVDI